MCSHLVSSQAAEKGGKKEEVEEVFQGTHKVLDEHTGLIGC